MTAPALLVTDLTRRFRNGRGVGPVDLRVDPGETVSLVGPNGSGKTTLLRCLATRSRPQSGSCSWFGNSGRAGARGRLGVVFDATSHADELSARQNLSFFAAARGASAAQAESALTAAEISEVGDEPVASYSFGMRRRLLLAEALAGEPELLLLDEPTLGLDVQGQRWLVQVIKDRMAGGLATVVSTNDTEFVEEAASRVCFLVEGRVVRDSPLRELMRSLGGRREIRMSCRGNPSPGPLTNVPGVERVAKVEGGLLVLAKQRDGLLADLLAALGDLDRTLVDLSVREPGLADCFLQLTGTTLDG